MTNGDVDAFERRARSFVQSRFPRARAAFLGGSAASGDATATSDLDILVVLPDEHDDVSFIETSRYDGQLVEAFVYGADKLQWWLEKGRGDFRPVLDRLIGSGIPLIPGEVADALVTASREVLDSGPAPTAREIDQRRYGLSALLDDLNDAKDVAERVVVTATMWRESAELAVLADRRWIGTGKWLIRELRAGGDPFGLVAFAAGSSCDADALAEISRNLIDSLGGYLQEGFVRGHAPPGLRNAVGRATSPNAYL